jgi:PQQ-dependent dehydrogenase (s-GDH family)
MTRMPARLTLFGAVLAATFAGVVLAVMSEAAIEQDPTLVRNPPEKFTIRVVTSGLEGPWELTWGPDQQLWATERRGKRVVRINPRDGARTTLLTIPDVLQTVGQDGLLGLALHPDLLKGGNLVYVAFTYDNAAKTAGQSPGGENAIARRMAIRSYQYNPASGSLTNPVDVITGLPTHNDHVGGRLAIGPDLTLYLTIGDQGSNFGSNRCNANHAQTLPTAAQVQARDWSNYQGKILRLNLDGSIPPDNPEIDGVRSHVFSVGHRNQLGIAFGPGGLLYESEHGPSTDDEVNLIESGRNYGWPNVAGYRDDKVYTYDNWSASSPEPCRTLKGGNTAPASVPSQAETAWTHPRFAPPLRTFFTVESAADVRGIGSATFAPGGLDVYTAAAIPGWRNSVLALSLIRGVVYRLKLSDDGRSIAGSTVELFPTANRYRDIAMNPDGRTFYLATDPEGPSRDAAGATRTLANPGSILEFTYTGH